MTSRGRTYQSRTYMWNADDFLARGATGHVYKGYNRTTGEKVAVKMFTNQSEFGAMQREMNAIRSIPKHDNIVQCLETEEREKSDNTYIIVMELCNAGSLYEVIDNPENAYGLDEEQFKLVVLHVSRGLCHLKKKGFVHRDIKPGNILRVKDVDGRYTFKLTDFGTARQLNPDEKFTSLHGTEEYLYPAMYERALINPRVRTQFQDKVDLWSLGATFFHVATGRLPFQPYLKRNDQRTMYSITASKVSGMILGWQTQENGKIWYSEDLPPDTTISNGLKAVITPVLAGLIENDLEKMWTFNHFFDYVELINRLWAIDVFCVSKCSLIKVYLKPDFRNPMGEFKDSIAQQTGLSAQHMEFYHENIPIKRPRQGQPFKFPVTTPDSPITMFGGPPQQSSMLETPPLPEIPKPHSEQSVSLTDDLRYAKDCCKVVWSYVHSAEYLARTYKLMHQAANCLRQTVQQEYLNLREKADKVGDLYGYAIRQLEAHINGLQYEISVLQSIQNANNNPDIEVEVSRLAEEVKTKRHESIKLKDDRNATLNMDSFLAQIEKLLEGGSSMMLLETQVFDGGIRKLKNYMEEVKDIFEKFQEEKKNRTSQDTFSKRVNAIRKNDVTTRMKKAMTEVSVMVETRSQVYSKLYELLAMCISLREELRNAEESLSHCIDRLQSNIKVLEQWLPAHHQAMKSVYQRVVGGGTGGRGIDTPSIPSQQSSLPSSELLSLTAAIYQETKATLSLAEQQKGLLSAKRH